MARVEAPSGLVEQARRLAGRSPAEEERRTLTGPDGPLVPLTPPPVRPALDGYVRQSPPQPLYGRADRTRRRVRWAVIALAVLAVIGVAAILLLR